jgi:hypothetical protein
MIVSIVLRRRAGTEVMDSDRELAYQIQIARATGASINAPGGTDLI